MSSIHTTCLPRMLLSGWVFGCYFCNCRIHLFLTNDVRGGNQKTACLYIVHQEKSSDRVDIFTLTHTQQPPRFNHLKKVSYFLSDRTISPNSELRCCTVCFTDDINKWIIPNDSAPLPLKAALVISESATGSVKQEHETSPKNNWISGENFRILLIYFPHSGTDLTLMLMLSAVCCCCCCCTHHQFLEMKSISESLKNKKIIYWSPVMQSSETDILTNTQTTPHLSRRYNTFIWRLDNSRSLAMSEKANWQRRTNTCWKETGGKMWHWSFFRVTSLQSWKQEDVFPSHHRG